MTSTITLQDLADSARTMGLRGHIDSLAGNVVGLHIRPRVDGPLFLITLDDGTHEGTEWTVGLWDGSEDSGALPVTGDADQTLLDALAWTRGEDASATD